MKVCPHCSGAYPVDEGFCPMDGTRLRTLHATTEGAGEVDPNDDMRELVGRVLDRRYRLDAVIGTGAMGVVFRATHTLIGRSFAVKVLRREHLDSGDVARRFLLEARVASSIKHPNVVDISDFGELPEGGAYYVMELLEGRSLANAIDTGGPMAPADAGLVALQIAGGLAAAHAMGVVHRDLKPDNVFLCAPRRGVSHSLVKLLDFGIARVGPRRITVAGSVLGTPEYLSPEMAQGHDVDHRADLYALGIIMFELLTATVPFYHKDIARTIEMHVRAPRPTLASRRPDLARFPNIAELITSLMAVSREDRPSSADVVARTLGAALSHDLDREAALVVHRATLAIGSNLLQEVADPSRPAHWPASEPWPVRGPQLGSDQASDKAAAPPPLPAPAPIQITPFVEKSGVKSRRSGARAAAAAIGAAVVAAGVTFGVVRWVGLAAPREADATPPIAAQEPIAIVESSVGDDATSVAKPPAVIAELPAPAPAVISATQVSDASESRPPPVAERTKAKRRKSGAAEVAQPSASTPAKPTRDPRPPSSDPSREVKRDDPTPRPTSSPRDLKDPFPDK